VGVRGKCSGTLGRADNCKAVVTARCVDRVIDWPINTSLYPPRAWAEDRERQKQARVPEGGGVQDQGGDRLLLAGPGAARRARSRGRGGGCRLRESAGLHRRAGGTGSGLSRSREDRIPTQSAAGLLRALPAEGWLIGERPPPGRQGDHKFYLVWGLDALSLGDLLEVAHSFLTLHQSYGPETTGPPQTHPGPRHPSPAGAGFSPHRTGKAPPSCAGGSEMRQVRKAGESLTHHLRRWLKESSLLREVRRNRVYGDPVGARVRSTGGG
jgi:hypothetical protein